MTLPSEGSDLEPAPEHDPVRTVDTVPVVDPAGPPPAEPPDQAAPEDAGGDAAGGDAAGGEEERVAAAPPEFRQVRFVGVEMQLPSPYPMLVLQEVDAPYRRLEIMIGAAEGIAIAYAARRVPTPRPLTHELFTQVLTAFGVELAAVRVTEVNGSAFRAELAFASPRGNQVLSCRPSDAIALALRQHLDVPITVAAPVLDAVGV